MSDTAATPTAPLPADAEFDITIVGAGPVGLFAAFYAGLRTMKVKLVDSLAEPGGRRFDHGDVLLPLPRRERLGGAHELVDGIPRIAHERPPFFRSAFTSWICPVW